jgi:hypothetical protein
MHFFQFADVVELGDVGGYVGISAAEAGNSRLNPDDSSSPVDLGCRISAKYAFFQAERKRIPKTEDSLAERVGFELAGDFLSRQ